MKKTIYLANPYGFSTQQKALLLPPIIAALEGLGLEVWEPFARNNQPDFTKAGWAYEIGQRDYRDVAQSDAIFAVVNGVPPDEGVMVELGMAIALGKPTFLFRDDSRRAPARLLAGQLQHRVEGRLRSCDCVLGQDRLGLVVRQAVGTGNEEHPGGGDL